jgi:hypothetical protein
MLHRHSTTAQHDPEAVFPTPTLVCERPAPSPTQPAEVPAVRVCAQKPAFRGRCESEAARVDAAPTHIEFRSRHDGAGVVSGLYAKQTINIPLDSCWRVRCVPFARSSLPGQENRAQSSSSTLELKVATWCRFLVECRTRR